jgi:hypothetical protein
MKMSASKAFLPIMLCAMAIPTAANAQSAPESGSKWASCYLEASGGVGTSIAFLVFEPFEVSAENVASVSMGIGSRFHDEVGVGTVVPNYTPFMSFGSSRCTLLNSEADARAKYAGRMNAASYAIIKSVAWKPTYAKPAKKVSKADASGKKSPDADAKTSEPAVTASKYVEVRGPGGTMRLSPEVVARNQAAKDDYERKLKEHADALARAKADQAAVEARHAERIAKAEAERREYERKLAANAASNAAAQEQYKTSLKPAGVNAVYRGFSGPTCEFARRSALFGAGTSKGTQFVEVAHDLSMPGHCIVQGWWWNTSKTGSSRQ